MGRPLTDDELAWQVEARLWAWRLKSQAEVDAEWLQMSEDERRLMTAILSKPVVPIEQLWEQRRAAAK